MASRYEKYAKKNKGYYPFTLYPSVIPNNVDFYQITVSVGDRLDLLAKRYFKNSKYWWVIAMVNDIPGDSLIVQPGTTLYIPKQVTTYVY